jgi:hypothetical protein
MSAFRVIWYRVPDACVNGPYAVNVRRVSDDRTVSSCTGIRNQIEAARRASEYGWSFGIAGQQAPIERVYCPGQAAEMSHTEAVNAARDL